MNKEEFYNLILKKSVIVTGGTPELSFNFNGVVNDIIDDTIIIDKISISFNGKSVKINKEDEHFIVHIDNENVLILTLT